MEASQHKTVGEHMYDGVVFHAPIRSENLDKLKQIVFDDQDVIVMSYPKSGKYNITLNSNKMILLLLIFMQIW